MLYKFDGNRPRIGNDTFVAPTALVIGDVVIADNCYIGHSAIIRGDYGRIEIGEGTAVEESVVIHAPPGATHEIGRRVTLGHGAICHGLRIGDMAVIGMGAILSINTTIGNGSIVAEGSVVPANTTIADNMVAAGNPAATKREVRDTDRQLWDFGKQLYIDLAKKYLELGMEPVGE
ncbi:MAG: gamma carbonic anhydrase family protein [Thermodesulfobacteriota bacterium]|nr:gamma carbonic anhydrase family protein [Thermodesulfobacteriota bacterium]